jgi:hypothetical protein
MILNRRQVFILLILLTFGDFLSHQCRGPEIICPGSGSDQLIPILLQMVVKYFAPTGRGSAILSSKIYSY